MKPTRAAVTLLGLLLGVGLALIAAPAGADVPQGWGGEPAPAVDKLHALLLLAGIPIGLALVISILTLAPGLARGEGLISSPSDEPDWLGGPTDGVEALPPGESSGAGGSSGSW